MKDIVVKDDDFVNNSTVMDGLADGTIMGKDDKPYTKYKYLVDRIHYQCI